MLPIWEAFVKRLTVQDSDPDHAAESWIWSWNYWVDFWYGYYKNRPNQQEHNITFRL